jgi:signal transduction histidine kinase
MPVNNTASTKHTENYKLSLIQSVSHEYRTPLSVISSSAELIEKYVDGGNNEAVKGHLEKIKRAVSQMSYYMDEVQLFNMLIENKVEVNSREIELSELLTEVIDHYRLRRNFPNKITFSVNPEKIYFKSDLVLIKRVLENLLSNAVKYSPSGKEIEIICEKRPETLVIKVKDCGIGITPEDSFKIFQPFTRGNNSLFTSGSGIGLTIVDKILNLLNGSIEFSSCPGEGTVFIVKLQSISGK